MKLIRAASVACLLCCAILPVFGSGGKEQPLTGVVGNLLQHQSRAADFTLTDQHGAPFHMAATKGKVVLMSFIYTHCTDICPFIALKMKDAYALLGSDAANVVFVAVTTDPKRDVPEVTAAYSRELGLFDAWHFVGGTPQAVQAVWAGYGIGVTIDPGHRCGRHRRRKARKPAGQATIWRSPSRASRNQICPWRAQSYSNSAAATMSAIRLPFGSWTRKG